MNTRNRQAFTLVEILIVVIILGILAAIVIPQFTNASQSAKASSLQSQLQTLRSQIELYHVQHDIYPALGNGEEEFWDQLTKYTDKDGDTSDTKSEVFKYGPYLQQASRNQLVNSIAQTKVVAMAATGDPAVAGWYYNEDTGQVKGMMPDAIATLLDLDGLPEDFVYEAAAE